MSICLDILHPVWTYFKSLLEIINEEKEKNTVKETLLWSQWLLWCPDGDVEGMCSTHRDYPVAYSQRAVSVCRSPVCDARDIDSLNTDERHCQMFKLSWTFVDIYYSVLRTTDKTDVGNILPVSRIRQSVVKGSCATGCNAVMNYYADCELWGRGAASQSVYEWIWAKNRIPLFITTGKFYIGGSEILVDHSTTNCDIKLYK